MPSSVILPARMRARASTISIRPSPPSPLHPIPATLQPHPDHTLSSSSEARPDVDEGSLGLVSSNSDDPLTSPIVGEDVDASAKEEMEVEPFPQSKDVCENYEAGQETLSEGEMLEENRDEPSARLSAFEDACEEVNLS